MRDICLPQLGPDNSLTPFYECHHPCLSVHCSEGCSAGCVCVCVCVFGGGDSLCVMMMMMMMRVTPRQAAAAAAAEQTGSGLRQQQQHHLPPPPITTSSSSSSAAAKGAQCCSKLVSPLLSSPLLPGLRCSGSAAGCAACRPCSRCFSPDSQRLPRICLTTNWATSITAKSNASSPSKTKALLK